MDFERNEALAGASSVTKTKLPGQMKAGGHWKLLASLAAFFGIFVSAAAMTFEDIGRQVAAKNPDLAAARFMIEEARGRNRGAGRLMNPEVEVRGRHMTEGREAGFGIELMQKFPVTVSLLVSIFIAPTLFCAVEEWKWKHSQRPTEPGTAS